MPSPTVVPTASSPLIDRQGCHHLETALRREWIETDGLGGYASSTIVLCATRRYHGLLVAAEPGPLERHLFLSRFEETLVGADRSFDLGMARYPGTWSPQGHQALEEFDLRPYPAWRYRIGRATILRELLMVQGQPATILHYRIFGQIRPVTLRLRPLVPFRRADSLTFQNLSVRTKADRIPGGVQMRLYPGLPPLSVTIGGLPADFHADPLWFRHVEYQADLERGYDGHEDNFSPGWLEVPLGEDGELWVAAAVGKPVADPKAVWEAEAARRQNHYRADAPRVQAALEQNADQFLYRAPRGRTGVIAGYPWFGEWGRDTFLSLPGLLLARGRVEEFGQALADALPYLKNGLLPNIFGPTIAESHYGSADASLWFARAVRLYEEAGGDRERMESLLAPALEEVAEELIGGTRLGLQQDPCGLLAAGAAGLNATWMDARVGDVPVTPRHGFAVELNALWYHLLAHLEQLSLSGGDDSAAEKWGDARCKTGRSFLDRFWLPDGEYLADVWRDGEADRSVRPNMLVAAALEFSPLTPGKRCDVLSKAEDQLLTPRGLRTLAPDHPDYCNHYRGGTEERDRAYHQGTVWPWLLGFYVEASLRAHGATQPVRERLRALLDGFQEHLLEAGLLHISEVFDGDPPHPPGGTPAQAWSTAEILRAYRLLDEAEA